MLVYQRVYRIGSTCFFTKIGKTRKHLAMLTVWAVLLEPASKVSSFRWSLTWKTHHVTVFLSKNRLALFFKYPKTHLNTYYWIIMFCFWNSRTMPNWMLPFPFRLSTRSLRVFYKALAGDGSKWLAQQNGASLVYTKQQRFLGLLHVAWCWFLCFQVWAIPDPSSGFSQSH